jgi:hypothetical protein
MDVQSTLEIRGPHSRARDRESFYSVEATTREYPPGIIALQVQRPLLAYCGSQQFLLSALRHRNAGRNIS